MAQQRSRPVHNTNSPNFIKLDYQDLTYIKEWASSYLKERTTDGMELTKFTDMEVTIQRVELMMKFMEEKRETDLQDWKVNPYKDNEEL